MFMPNWQWYLLFLSVVISVLLHAHTVYIVQESRSAKSGVTTGVVTRTIINLIVSAAMNAGAIYMILNQTKR